MTVIIEVDGCQAVPIRAVPYVGDWQEAVWPADIAHACATPPTTNRSVKVSDRRIAHGPVHTQHRLIAQTMNGAGHRPMQHTEWERIAERLRTMPVETEDDIRKAIEVLPERAFVWLEDLQRYFTLTRPLNFNPDRPDEHIVGFEDTDPCDEDESSDEDESNDEEPVPIYAPKSDALNFDPHIPSQVSVSVLRGFQDRVGEQIESDLPPAYKGMRPAEINEALLLELESTRNKKKGYVKAFEDKKALVFGVGQDRIHARLQAARNRRKATPNSAVIPTAAQQIAGLNKR